MAVSIPDGVLQVRNDRTNFENFFIHANRCLDIMIPHCKNAVKETFYQIGLFSLTGACLQSKLTFRGIVTISQIDYTIKIISYKLDPQQNQNIIPIILHTAAYCTIASTEQVIFNQSEFGRLYPAVKLIEYFIS